MRFVFPLHNARVPARTLPQESEPAFIRSRSTDSAVLQHRTHIQKSPYAVARMFAHLATSATLVNGPVLAKWMEKQFRFLNPNCKIMKLKSASLAVVAALTFVALPALADDHDGNGKAMQDPMVKVLKEQDGKAFESAFLSLMIHHHESGKKMASLGEKKATSPELKELAAKIGKQQTKEIAQMTTWLKEWHSKSPDHSIVPEESKKMEASVSASLESKSGAEFDKFFASKMAEHHASAIEMAKLEEHHSEHAEVKAMAKEMVAMQEKEKEKLQTLAEK
jgi:uncharacterized protein (DUF305 family)